MSSLSLTPGNFLTLATPDKLWGTSQTNVDTVRRNKRRVSVDLLRICLSRKKVVTLWGPVGARKTRTIQALAREVDSNGVPFQVITMQPSTQDPTIIHGMMYTALESDGATIMRRSVPDVVKQIVKHYEDHNGLTILFLDEMTTCMPAQQNACLGLLTHLQFEGFDVSPYVSIVMAANPEGTVSIVNPLSEAVINRSAHLPWFGDLDLFLDEWSSGFGQEELVPEPTTEWYVRELLKQDRSHAFRSAKGKADGWSEESLVPYDLFEHSERVTTDLAELITAINETFAASPDEIRHHYIVEMTRAFMGHQWAKHMGVVTSLEAQSSGHEVIVERIRSRHITTSTTGEDLASAFTDVELTSDRNGNKLPVATVHNNIKTLAKQVDKSVTRGELNKDGFVGAWAAIALSSQDDAGAFLAEAVQLLKAGRTAVRNGLIEKAESIPAFVSPEIRSALRGHLESTRRTAVAS